MINNNNKYIAGTYKQRLEYKSFEPSAVPRQYKWHNRTIDLMLSEAMVLLGKLDGIATIVPNIDLFIMMYATKDAVASSRIEGTRTEFDQALKPANAIRPEEKDDWQEVQNYLDASRWSLNELHKLPLSIRLLKGAHRRLLSGVRGKEKLPGEIRRSQNWIGGSSLSDAFFIPPSSESLPELLSDLELFWHERKTLPPLIKIAISHYQFETIHPFLDGNGRIGRLLILLQLIDMKILSKPCFYLSGYFEKNKASYFDALTMVHKSNDLDQWLCFFLSGIMETAEDSISVFKKIFALQKRYEKNIQSMRSTSAHTVLESLFKNPFFTLNQLSKTLNINYATIAKIIAKFESCGMVKEITSNKRNRLFALHEYIDLFK